MKVSENANTSSCRSDFGFSCELQSWSAWSPDLSSLGQWVAWAGGPSRLSDARQKPLCPQLPPNQRRRATNLSRAALQTAMSCISKVNSAPSDLRLVFASRHGEGYLTLGLLESVAQKEMLSPNDFSLSVHNSASGICSQASGITGCGQALAAGDDTWVSAWLEAGMAILEGAKVLLTLYDERLPEPFHEEGRYYPFFAAAFLLSPLACDEDVPRMEVCRVLGSENAERGVDGAEDLLKKLFTLAPSQGEFSLQGQHYSINFATSGEYLASKFVDSNQGD